MLPAHSPLKMDYLSIRNGQQQQRNRTYGLNLLLKHIPRSLQLTLEKNKTYRIIGNRYYQPGMVIDINRYIQNCNDCYRSIIPRDKTLGLLKPLLILERPQQYIFIDFYKLPIDRNRYNMAIVIVNRFSKRLFLIPYYKNINVKEAA